MTETLRAEFETIAISEWRYVPGQFVRDGDEYLNGFLQARWQAAQRFYRAGRESASKGVASNVYATSGVCYAHGPFDGGHCPKWPACSTDPQKPEFLAMGPVASKGEGQESRTAKDYAIEHGGYLADAAQHYLDAKNSYDMAVAGLGNEVPDSDQLSDCHQSLRSAIYNFRKRAEKAKHAPLSPGSERPVDCCGDAHMQLEAAFRMLDTIGFERVTIGNTTQWRNKYMPSSEREADGKENPVCPKCKEGVSFSVTMHLGLGQAPKPLFISCGACGHFIGNFDRLPAAQAFPELPKSGY